MKSQTVFKLLKYNVITVLVLFSLVVIATSNVIAQITDTSFIAMDNKTFFTVFSSSESDPAKVGEPIDELASIVVLCVAPDSSYFLRLISVRADNGEQVGARVDVDFPPGPCVPPTPIVPPDPIRVLNSELFRPGEIVVVTKDLVLMTIPLLLGIDGSPDAGSWTCQSQIGSPETYGGATAITEMDGADFEDGQPRLIIGTSTGQVLVVENIPGASGVQLENAFSPNYGTPINDLLVIPQYGYNVLGVVKETTIYGIINPEVTPITQFTLSGPAGNLMASMAVLTGVPPTPIQPVEFALAGIVNPEVKWGNFPADMDGAYTLNIFGGNPPDDNKPIPLAQLRNGSLLMLYADSSEVIYDPDFSVAVGFSGCTTELTSGPGMGCCCLNRADVDRSGELNISDLTYFVDYLFRGGPPSVCPEEADIDHSDTVDISDLTYFVDYLFRGGEPTPGC